MNKKKKQTGRKQSTYIILCCETLLILTLLAVIGICLYAEFSGKKQNSYAKKEIYTDEAIGDSFGERIEPESTEGIVGEPIVKESEKIPEEAQTEPASEAEALPENTPETYAQGVKYFEPAKEGEVTIAFAGDILFDDEYSIMANIKQRPNGIFDTFSADLLAEMTSADIFIVNNEFPYTNRGEPTPEKTFTFRADPETAACLLEMGADIVTLANNHAYDYGEISLLDSLDTLAAMEMPYVGAGRNLDEASRPFYFETQGLRIGFLSSTQIERLDNPDTKGATENSAGVFRSWTGDLLYEKAAEAKENCDFLVVYVHWGSENTTELDWAQKEQARRLAESGADLIIGAHSHCLQGIEMIQGVPVFYSLGNFLFNSKTLDTCLVKATLSEGKLSSLQFVPALQKGCRTELLTGSEKTRVIEYMKSLSPGVELDGEGYIIR